MVLARKNNRARIAALVILALLSLDMTDLTLCQSLDGHVAVETQGSSCCVPQQSCETLAIIGGPGAHAGLGGSALLEASRQQEADDLSAAPAHPCDDVSLVHAVLGNRAPIAHAPAFPATSGHLLGPPKSATPGKGRALLPRKDHRLSLLRTTFLLI